MSTRMARADDSGLPALSSSLAQSSAALMHRRSCQWARKISKVDKQSECCMDRGNEEANAGKGLHSITYMRRTEILACSEVPVCS
jgi:hypothetical protein